MSETAIPNPHISNRAFDYLFIIGTPVLAFTAVSLVSLPRSATGNFLKDPLTPEWFILMSTVLTHTHVMMVFFRSHGNPDVFKRFPLRFSLVPLLALAIFWVSPVAMGVMAFLALYWDEWHSLMQTFGFGRIYDARLGNDPSAGRKLDIGICFVLGLLPHVLLLTFLPEDVRAQGLEQFLDIPAELAVKYGHYIHSLKYPLLTFGISYVLFYVWSYARLIRNGYRYSRTKLALFGATGGTAIVVATFYSVTDAAYYGNIYHALQYFFIVSISEVPRLSRKFERPTMNRNVLLTFMVFVCLSLACAAALARYFTEGEFLGNFWLLTSLLHFWYDGFIWSVRKNDI